MADSLRSGDPDAYFPLIKICGVTRVEDGLVALAAGADWLGFVRWPGSPRFQPLEACIALLTELRERSARPFEAVGVYVDATRDRIEDECRRSGLDRVQLHGQESIELARSLSRPVIKALRIRGAESIHEAERYPGLDLLTDAFDAARHGGTGKGYDYALLRDLIRRRRVMIAGGLHAGNVGAVVSRLRPWGVDVSSAVESSPGLKDPPKIRAFIDAIGRNPPK